MLATFPRGTRLAILAPVDCAFDAIVEERGDPATSLIALADALPESLESNDNLLVEGLDAVADPIAVLRKLAAAAPSARLFALVSNAAHLRGLAAFYNGVPLAKAHPLVREEIAPLLGSGGWRVLEINALYDEAVALGVPLPMHVEMPGIRFTLSEEPMRARGRVYAFLAVADAS